MPVVGFIDGKDGLPGREGAFLSASFWLVDALIFCWSDKKSKALYY